jgi:hypothetical protein
MIRADGALVVEARSSHVAVIIGKNLKLNY